MEGAKPEYMWLVDEWMECAQSLARECNALRTLLEDHRKCIAELEAKVADLSADLVKETRG